MEVATFEEEGTEVMSCWTFKLLTSWFGGFELCKGFSAFNTLQFLFPLLNGLGTLRLVNQECISAYFSSALPLSNKSGTTPRRLDSNKNPEGGETLLVIAFQRNPHALRSLIESLLLARPEYKPTPLQ